MKLYKFILLCSVVFQPFCFGMELPDAIETNYEKIKPYIKKEILDMEFYSENNIDKATKKYQEAVKLWDIDLQHAVRHMLEAEKLEHKEAKEKLKEIRKSKGYSDTKMASKNDPGMLLKFFEISPRAQYNAIMDWQGINKQYALDYFIELAECEDTPKNIKKQVIEQLTKIRKTNGYRKPSTVQCVDQSNNIGYLLYEKENNYIKPSSIKENIKNSTPSVQNSKNKNVEKINNDLSASNNNKNILKSKNVNQRYIAEQFPQGTEHCNTGNYQEAFKSSQIAFSQLKNVKKQETSNDIYSKTQGISQDSEGTLRYFNFVINQITVKTQFSLGMMYFQGQGVEKDLGKALTCFKLAADQGHAYAQFNLGAMYLEGLGVTQDLKEALRYFKLSAEQGYAVAQFTLSSMYYNGQGVKKNLKKAFKYCKRSALQGYMFAQFRMGIMCYKGQGGVQDLGEAIRYFKLAADQGHIEAQFNLGVIYSEDERVENNFEEALKYYKLAADQGHAEAQFNLGVMHYRAEGVEQGLENAFGWFKLSADQGCAEAQYNLGVMYSEAVGVVQNFTEALRYYKLAADQGHSEAQFNLGLMYYNGEGGEKDLNEAVRYFILAAEQGHEEAQSHLDSMDANASDIVKNKTVDFEYSQSSAAQEVDKPFNQIRMANEEGIHKPLLNNNSHDLLQTTVRPQNRMVENINCPLQQAAKSQSSDVCLGEVNASGNVINVKKTLITEENRRKTRKTQSLNNLKSCTSSFENFEKLSLNTKELAQIKISTKNNENKTTQSKFKPVIHLTSSPKEDEIVVKRKKGQKKNKLSITKIKLKNHSSCDKKLLNFNSLNNLDQSIFNESTDYSSSEKSLSDTPFEVLFNQDGKRDENLKQLKKLLNDRDLRKASEIKLNRSIVVRALRELGPNGKKIITWNFETNGNKNKSKISADIVRKTNNVNNSKIPSLNIHLHSPRGKWYDDVNIKNHFLDFIRFCDSGVNALIEEIERK